jgi:broad specificity phosphatase PhoE
VNPKSKIQNPKFLWFVRHGESTANVARHRAERENLLTIDFTEREPDVPLSAEGVKQSIAVGKKFANLKDKPTVVISSPYLRTLETTRLILETAKIENVQTLRDERLRERELGIFDRLTKRGGMRKFPEECAKREQLAKFYFRPPSGESWCDVALRVRGAWRDIRENFADENVLIVTHEAVIHLFRYILENLTEEEILAIDRACDVANCAVTTYEFNEISQKLLLQADNFPIKTPAE